VGSVLIRGQALYDGCTGSVWRGAVEALWIGKNDDGVSKGVLVLTLRFVEGKKCVMGCWRYQCEGSEPHEGPASRRALLAGFFFHQATADCFHICCLFLFSFAMVLLQLICFFAFYLRLCVTFLVAPSTWSCQTSRACCFCHLFGSVP